MQIEPPPLGEGEQAEIAQHFVGASLCVPAICTCLIWSAPLRVDTAKLIKTRFPAYNFR